MQRVQSIAGASLYGTGLGFATAGGSSAAVTGLPTALLAGAAIAGGVLGAAVAVTVLDHETLLATADRELGAYLTLLGFVVLLSGFVAVLFSSLPLRVTVPVLVGGAVAAFGGDLLYGAANRLRMDAALDATDVAVPIGRPLTPWFVTAARISGVVLLAILVAAGYLGLRSGDGPIVAMLALLGASILPELLFPARTGARTPGFGSERYLVEDGVLGWHGVTAWDEFESWGEDDGTIELHASGRFSSTTEVAPGSEADLDRARSLVGKRLGRREE